MDEMDRILGEDELIAPGAEFGARVMAAIREEAAVPPPLEFPWHRFLPGLFTCVALTLATFMLMGWAAESGVQVAPGRALLDLVGLPAVIGLSITGLSLGVTALLAWWAVRPASRSMSF